MSKSGNDINYSLRLQKNIERKIFSDIVRSMSYFGPVEEYRYIGFGSFYYQDFILFHKEFSIKEGISIEISKNHYVKNDDVVSILLDYLNNILMQEKDYWDKLYIELENVDKSCMSRYIDIISEIVSRQFIINLKDQGRLFPHTSLIKSGIYNYSKENTLNKLAPYVYGMIRGVLLEKIKVNKANIEDECRGVESLCEAHARCEEIVNKIGLDDLVRVETEQIEESLKNVCINRYTYNKPYGFINIIFEEASEAIDAINWDEEKRNIVWLDYDQFLEPNMLDAFEKVILKVSKGSVIFFSVSMKNTPEERQKEFRDKFKDSYRISHMPTLGECDTNMIHKTIYKIVEDTVVAAICDKNMFLNDGEDKYKYKQVLNCKYADGIPMFTYALFIYRETDDENDIYFPSNVLQEYDWFSDDEERYVIKFPALTNKEISAINQYLPETDEDTIIAKFPFIPSKTIKDYIKIYKYYPQYLEVGYYI